MSIVKIADDKNQKEKKMDKKTFERTVYDDYQNLIWN